MRVLDLFAGIGGFSLASHWMGWETVAFVERDKFCQKVLRKNFGQDIDIYDDICTFSGEPFRGRIDLITGGFPCQPFSAAGKRKGRDDERHLFPELLRVVDEVKPRWLVAENVRGLLSIESGSVFEEVHASLEGIGYAVQTVCVPASAVDAPHRRDRLWIIAADSQYAERNGFAAGAFTAGIGTTAGEQSTGANTAADVTGTDRYAFNATNNAAVDELSNPVTHPSGLSVAGHEPKQSTVFAGNGTKYSDRPTANSNSPRPQRSDKGTNRAGKPETRAGLRNFDESWMEAATRFCRVDDVVPNRVDRLKSLGNAVVPALVYEIFKAIETADADHGRQIQDPLAV